MREQIKKYFKSFPRWAVWMIGIGILLVPLYGLGLLLMIIGIWGLVDWGRRPSDAQMDAWLEQDLAALQRRALSKTGTDLSELVKEHVMLRAPRFGNTSNASAAFKKGKDNFWRFSLVNVTVINFTASQIIIYQCVLDRTTGNALNENTDEYFYQDVVSVATRTRSYNLQLQDGRTFQLNDAEMFQLTTSGGTSVEVFLRSREAIQQIIGGDGDIPTTWAEDAVLSVRKMLREKKSALVA